MTCHSVVLTGSDPAWVVAHHKDEAGAQKHLDELGSFQAAWTITKIQDIAEGENEMSIDQVNGLVLFLQPEGAPKFSTEEIDKGRQYILTKLAKRAKGGTQPATAKKSTESRTEGNMATAKKAPKVGTAAKKAPKVSAPKRAANGANGHGGRAKGFGDLWNKTLALMLKEAGKNNGEITREQMVAVCDKTGAKPWFMRLYKGDDPLLSQVKRGTYKFTAAGKRYVDQHA